MLTIITDLGLPMMLAIGVAALVTSAIHGATGVAGGFLMTAVLAGLIGVKPVVPIMSVALLISHSSRMFLNRQNFKADVFWAVVLPATPCIILAAWLYGKMSSSMLAIVLGLVVLFSIPLRRWASSRQIKTTKKSLMGVGAVYGALSGASIGSGMLLIPFMLGYGLSRQAFVGTLAAIALTTNVTRVSVFSTTQLLDTQYLLLGVYVGLVTIPGNMIGRYVLRKITDGRHAFAVDVLTVLGGINFLWLAFHQS